MSGTIANLLITSAASWYIAYAVTSTHGAFGMFEALREWRGGRWHGRHGYEYTNAVSEHARSLPPKTIATLANNGLLDCIVCLIFWLALIIGYLQGLTLIESIAAAAVGLWFHGYTGYRYNVQ